MHRPKCVSQGGELRGVIQKCYHPIVPVCKIDYIYKCEVGRQTRRRQRIMQKLWGGGRGEITRAPISSRIRLIEYKYTVI